MRETERIARNYNGLLPVKDATKFLNEHGGDETVGMVLEKIVELDLSEQVGLRLLHKHNDLMDHESMVEFELTDAEGYALVTRAVDEISKDSVPNSWLLTNEEFIPIEYSAAGLLCAQSFDLESVRHKFKELQSLLVDLQVDRVLGPCINYSDIVLQGRSQDEIAFLEKTDIENRANVVRPVARTDPSFTNSAKTKWYAKRIVDASGKTSWMTACNCFCSVMPEGGHQGTTTHIYSGDEDDARKKKDKEHKKTSQLT